MSLEAQYMAALNRLAKWRAAYAGWQLGTRSKSDPEAQAVRDTREALLILRAEVNAITGLLVKKRIISVAELQSQIIEECEHLQSLQEQKFPGFKATEDGLTIDTHIAIDWMEHWLP